MGLLGKKQESPRGEATLVLGKDSYTLHFDWNAVADCEEQLGSPFYDLFERIAAGRFGVLELRAFLWAGLRKRHPQVTLRQTGELLDEADFGDVADVVIRAVSSAFVIREGSKGNAKAAAGVGTSS